MYVCASDQREKGKTEAPKTRLELVRDVELVGVEEEEDEVRALGEPPAHVGEVVAGWEGTW